MMMKKLVATFTLIAATTVATDAYAGLVIRFRNGTILCIGKKDFCKEVLSTAEIPGYGDNLSVRVAGELFTASSVSLSSVSGDFGVVTVEQGSQIIFEGTVYLPDVIVTDIDSGHSNALGDLAKLDACN